MQTCDNEAQKYQDQVDEAVKSLLEWEANRKVPEKPAEIISFHNFAAMGSMDIDPEEERNFSEFMKEQGIDISLSEIEEFDKLLNMARSEEGRKTIYERNVAMLKQQHKCKCSTPCAPSAPSAPSTPLVSEEVKVQVKVKQTKPVREQPVKKTASETVKLTVPKPIVKVKKFSNLP